MGFLNDLYAGFSNTVESISNWGKGVVEDIATWGSNLANDVGAAITSSAQGDVVGINANKVPDMIAAIEEYINRVNSHLNQIKENTSTADAMKGEYAAATKQYVQAACDVCYRITSQLRYFEDRLITVQEAYTKKDQSMSSTINTAKSEMQGSWAEYKRQK